MYHCTFKCTRVQSGGPPDSLMSTINSGLSGEGDVDLTGQTLPGVIRVKVTNLGMAHPIGSSTAVKRYVDIGWIAPFESGVPTDQDGPDSCYYAAQFVEYEFQSFDWVDFVAHIEGISGYHYSFKTGVVADIVIL